MNVEIFSLDAEGIAQSEYRSLGLNKTTMHLNVSDNHLSFIHRFDLYARQYRCKFCLKVWPSSWPCKRHESSCDSKDKFIYPGGFHTPAKNMFNILNDIDVHTQQCTYPWFIVYDFESIQPSADTQTAGKIELQREHHPISVSVCSNVPQFQDPKCFVNPESEVLIQEMLMYMREIQSKAEKLAHERWKDAASEINEELKELGKKEKAAESTGDSEEFTREDAMRQKQVLNARGKFQTYMRQIPVLGFNSSRFDINLVKQKLLLQLGLHATASNSEYIIKKGNAYICISSEHFKFLDISQFLSARPQLCFVFESLRRQR